mgnify:CR=1 FL=1
MKDSKDSLTHIVNDNEKVHLKELLTTDDLNSFSNLVSELQDSYKKDTLFRTEIEMKFSVLNDASCPTRGSKYWQSVKEQKTHMCSLIDLSFDYRKNQIDIKEIKRKLEKETDEIEIERLKLELDMRYFSKRNNEFEAGHRIRELKAWSKIKKELNDGSFNTKNAEEHQLESWKKVYENKAKSITPGTPQGDVFNIYGQLQTLDRLLNEKQMENAKKESLEE